MNTFNMKVTVYKPIEIEVTFPCFTYDSSLQNYYANIAENKCIQLSYNESKSKIEYLTINYGLTYNQIPAEQFYKAFDLCLNDLLTKLDK